MRRGHLCPETQARDKQVGNKLIQLLAVCTSKHRCLPHTGAAERAGRTSGCGVCAKTDAPSISSGTADRGNLGAMRISPTETQQRRGMSGYAGLGSSQDGPRE